MFRRTKRISKFLKNLIYQNFSDISSEISSEIFATGNIICYLFRKRKKQRVRSRAGLPEESNYVVIEQRILRGLSTIF